MRAVWSFWTPPFAAHHHERWPSLAHQLYSWVLSFETARVHYPDTLLVTDRAGADLLVGELGLEFHSVSLALDEIAGEDPDWWVHGKLVAYSLQEQPFVHIDYDAYLWKPLPVRLANAPIFAQNPEGADIGCYDPDAAEYAITTRGDGHIPPEWTWYRQCPRQQAACCGILGGRDTDLIRHYAATGLQLIRSEGNRQAFNEMPGKGMLNMLFEQYLVSAIAAWHGVPFTYLFPSFGDALDSEKAADAGFTHLMASAKAHPEVSALLERRVSRDYPALYSRCQSITERRAGGAAA